jgi:hypothetical protein
MNSLYDASSTQQLQDRINRLSPDAQRQWGTMDAAQMLAHCAITMEMATGQKKLPRLLIGRILGPLVKPSYVGPKPFKQNSPTDKSFITTGEKKDFEKEKAKLQGLIKQFSAGGPDKCTTHPHSFFGKLTPEQWATGMYKHLDHHLRQFGV